MYLLYCTDRVLNAPCPSVLRGGSRQPLQGYRAWSADECSRVNRLR